MPRTLRTLIAGAGCGIVLVIASGISAAAASPTTGQPGAPANTCGSPGTSTPGRSANSPGAPFNPNGQSGLVYAGNPQTASLAHSNSTVAISQYDVACFKVPGH